MTVRFTYDGPSRMLLVSSHRASRLVSESEDTWGESANTSQLTHWRGMLQFSVALTDMSVTPRINRATAARIFMPWPLLWPRATLRLAF